MSTLNGSKQFLFVIVHERGSKLPVPDIYVLRGDHDPTPEEVIQTFKCDFRPDEGDQLHIERYGLDELPVLPPRKVV